MTKFIKIFIFIGTLFVIVLVILTKNQNRRTQTTMPTTPPYSTGVKYENIVPGVSTVEDVTNTFGLPIAEEASGSAKILEFRSKNPNFNNQFVFQSGTVEIIKQQIAYGENVKITDLTKIHNLPQYKLYGPISENGYHLFVYPDKGLAYIGNEDADILLEIWYFKPMTYLEFKEQYAKEYSEEYRNVVGQ